MAVHELGHVTAAWLSGGEVVRVVLHPLTISRTDLGDNPHPLFVVWAGPVAGVLIPLLALPIFHMAKAKSTYAQFFAGFCLIANGAYIGGGAIEGVGDCGVMLRHGTPLWVMLLFGVVAVVGGLLLWHRMGSLKEFWRHPEETSVRATVVMLVALLLVLVTEFLLSPR